MLDLEAWKMLGGVLSLLITTLGGLALAWIALRRAQSEMVAKVEAVEDKVEEKTNKIVAQNTEQSSTIARLEIRMDGRVEDLIQQVKNLSEAKEDAALKAGIQVGISQERERQEQLRARLLTDEQAARRVVVADAETAADHKLAKAAGVALERIAAGNTPVTRAEDTHAELTDKAHLAVQDLSDESKPGT